MDNKRLNEVHNLIGALIHLQNRGSGNWLVDRLRGNRLVHGWVSAMPYLNNVHSRPGLSKEVRQIWEKDSPVAAFNHVVAVAFDVSEQLTGEVNLKELG